MKKILCFPIAFLLLVSSIAFSSDEPVASKWTAAPPKLDGLNDDWVDDALSFEKSVSVDYAFRNDGRNLYILFLFKDPKFLSTVDLSGITVYPSPADKKQKDQGVRFLRKNVKADELIAIMEKKGTSLTEERKQEIRKSPMYILYEAEAVNKKGEVVPASGTPVDVDPPTFRLQRQGKILAYEFRIPLASRELHPAGAASAPGESLRVGFEWGGMTEEMKKAMASGIGADGVRAGATDTSMDTTLRGGDENEGKSRGMSMAESSPELARMRQGPKKYAFWVDVRLAQAQ